MQTHRCRATLRIGLGLLALVAAGAGGCARPTVTLDDVGLAAINLQKVDLVFDLLVSNPNPVSLDVSGLDYALTAIGQELAKGTTGEGSKIAANADGHVKVPVSLSYDTLRSLWQKASAHEAVPFELAADVGFKAFGMPIKVPLKHAGEIPPMYAPSFSFRQVRPAGIDSVEVLFDVENPNSFELPLQALAGALKYGDSTLLTVEKSSLPAVAARSKTTLAMPIKLDAAGIAKIAGGLATGSIGGQKLRFDGDLKFGTPELLRAMLLGKKEAQ